MTNSGGSSARLYWESFDSPDTTQVSLPIGISLFPKEIFRCTKRLAKTRYQDLVFFNSEHQKGGHFASMEQPDALTKDLRVWLTELRNRDIV